MRRRNVLAASAAVTTAGLLAGSAPAAHARNGRRVRTGFANLAASGYRELRGQRVGIISNPTGITSDLSHEVDVMHFDSDVDLRAVFGPEHGFRGTSQAGQGEDFFEDPKTGLPVYNAYNDPQKMKDYFAERELETVVFDIQDVGSRFYTYIWTMYLAMDAAAQAGCRFVVLDRPNPTTASNAYGPILHEKFATFVGLKPISQRHGMTVGELAELFNGEFLDNAVDLTVVEMSGWRRRMSFDETGLPWVPPSPNMPQIGTARLYPGTCLFEASALSEGRGTTLPFQLIGAPDIDHRWEEALNKQKIPGVRFREAYFVPTFSKWSGKTCGGVEVQVTDYDRFDPIRTALAMIITQREVFPKYGWRTESDPNAHPWIDKLTGSAQVRKAIEAGADVDEVMEGWKSELDDFRDVRAEYLRYR
ncbi:exo-beta-N-acetylmuramidase NamZ family protein [Stackebrandtia nassauensis]|uniref:DUF1343 domain-containing protein n=1 Tax=Stackebrandtia nassauensis (strain DSM 44728 / CIP 108903 / NRRL B-16338 / NBRC 102104 / LLR-40K-21) TaxID=446470 RepID=D3PV19_STANL|nr:DUF1343 domain-containing protein [Stackebrandtia nassauensis]ADD41072.1 conserved hypothetical protein [Stackebrandtia nassauensis DSM 44728]